MAAKKCSQSKPIPCLFRAAVHWRVSFSLLLRKARCESGLNPLAYYPGQIAESLAEKRLAIFNGRSSGLMAFKPGTWQTTPYRRRSIWLAKWNALAGGWMHRVGRGGEWVCA